MLSKINGTIKKVVTFIMAIFFVSVILVGCKKIEVESITLDKTDIELTIGQTHQAVATVLPANSEVKFTWESDYPGVASVKDGLITALGNGDAVITVKAGSKEATIKVKVFNKIEVTFNSNGGSKIEKLYFNKNDKAVEPTEPTKVGYVFDGWYTDSTSTTRFDFDSVLVENITVYAKWKDAIYEVIFNVNGGTAIAPINAKHGTKLQAPVEPTKEGSVFGGWYADEAFATEYDFNSSITKATTVYAKWRLLYKVTFVVDGGSAVSDQSIGDGLNCTKPTNPTKEGFTFEGWYSAIDLLTTFDFNNPITKATSIYAKWKLIENKVTFNVNGGSAVAEQLVFYGLKASKPANPTKVGYTFVGWYTGSDLEYEYNFDDVILSATTIYAKWDAHTDIPYAVEHHVLNLETNEYTLDSTEQFIGTAGATVTIATKEFAGLMPEKDSYDVIIKPDGSLVVIVKYIKFSYSYEYVLNGGNFTYETRKDMVEDFLKDYNSLNLNNNVNYTLETLPIGKWSVNNFHNLYLNETFRDKWAWLPAYLGVVGSTTNKRACADVATVNTPAAFAGLGPNHIYALSYETRGFILGIKYTDNANWMSNDYSDFNLANGFWDTFAKYNEVTKFVNLVDPVTLVTTAYRDGFNFAGWYTSSDLTGEPVTVVSSKNKLYAKWEEKNPVTTIEITNPIGILDKLATYQLSINVLPADAYNKRVNYFTSNEKVLQVSDTGLITAINAGTATITIKTVNGAVSATIEITVLPPDDLDIKFSDGFNGTLYVDGQVQLTPIGVGEYKDDLFSFSSTNPSVLTVDNNGLVKGLTSGTSTIDVALTANQEVKLTITISVIEEPTTSKIDQLLALLTNANMPIVDRVNASLYYDNYSSFQQYYDATYGSVNLFLFDILNLDATTYLINPTAQKNKHSGLKSSTEFILVHDTANISGGLKNHGSYWMDPGHTTSIHFTVGDYGVVQDLSTAYVAHHAGDGTSTAFSWNDTGIAANGNLNPIIGISNDGFFTFNEVKSTILAPKDNSGNILDATYFTNLGPNWKIGTNGNYYLGTTRFDTSQVSRGVIASRGGNLNSTGIEMCVNKDGDIYDTWQRTAKLIGKLLIEHQLDTTRVIQHNTITGKNCPQSLIMSDYWVRFEQMVELEYAIQTKFANATISMVSNNPTILNNKGRIISQPLTSQTVTYTITVKIGSETKSITLGSVVPGTSSWNQLNGFFSTIK